MEARTVLLLLVAAAGLGQAAPRVKSITLAVTNPTGEQRSGENVTLRVKDLAALAPDFKAGTLIVTTADAGAMATTEIPSQADNLGGDGTDDQTPLQVDP